MTEFVGAGLQRNERVVYYTDDDSPERVLGILSAGGISTAEPVTEGQLMVVPMHANGHADQPFEPSRRVAGLNAAIDSALADGYSGLRATGEQWTTRELPSTELLVEYETRVGELCSTRSVAGLCQYDTRYCDAPLLDTVRGLHRHVVRNALVSDNEALRIIPLAGDEAGNSRFRVVGEADLSNCAMLLDTWRGNRHSSGDLHLDLGRLRFVDLRGVEALRELAAALRSSHRRLILHNSPPALRRIVQNLGGCLPDVEMAAR